MAREPKGKEYLQETESLTIQQQQPLEIEPLNNSNNNQKEEKRKNPKREQRKKIKEEREKGHDPQKKGPEKNNTDQNASANSARQEIESQIGKRLDKNEEEKFHREINKQGYDYHEMVRSGLDLFQ